jgi:hypothetical protein
MGQIGFIGFLGGLLYRESWAILTNTVKRLADWSANLAA